MFPENSHSKKFILKKGCVNIAPPATRLEVTTRHGNNLSLEKILPCFRPAFFFLPLNATLGHRWLAVLGHECPALDVVNSHLWTVHHARAQQSSSVWTPRHVPDLARLRQSDNRLVKVARVPNHL